MALNTCKMEMSGVIQSGTHELAHFVLALTHGAGGAMLSCFMLESAWPLCRWLLVCNPSLGLGESSEFS